MSNFIKALSMLLQDREVMKLDMKKIKDDLVLTVIPTKGKIHNITIPEEDLQDPDIDAKIMGLIHTPTEKPNFQHAATDAPEREEDEEEENEKESAGKIAPKADKKKVEKKAPPAKAEKSQDKKPGKKPGPKPKIQNENPGDAQHQKDLLDGLQEDSTEQNSAQDETKAPDPETKSQESETKAVESEIPAPEKQPDPAPASDGDLLGKFIENGQRFFAERKYSEAEAAWQCALDMDPENETVKTGLKKAQQWVKALSNIK